MSKHFEQWQELNQRQQATLSAIYHADQNAEREEAASWRLSIERRKADVWRRLRYPPYPNGAETYLHCQLSEARVIDPGLGSTLQALETRNLCECKHYLVRGKSELFSIKLTTEGRAVVRAGLGEAAPKKPPKGQLKQRQWEALATAYKAGEEGIKDDNFGDYARFSWRWTWLRLRDYHETTNGLVKEVGYWENSKYGSKLVITPKGIVFYEENKEKYQQLYPNTKEKWLLHSRHQR
jgi:hypothetical protein